MAGRPRHTLRSQLVLVVLLSLLPLAAFAGGLILWEARQQRETIERGVVDTTRALLTAVDRELAGTITTLEVIATHGVFDRGDVPAMYESLRRVLAGQPHWLTIHVAAADGRQLLNLRRPLGDPLPPIPERESFDRVVRTRTPHVGDVVFGPVVQQYSVPVRVPIVRGNQVRYVLTAIVPAASFDLILRSQRLPGDWLGTIADSRNVQLARSRAPDRHLGKPLSASLLEALTRSPEGFIRSRTFEGREMYEAYSRSPNSRWSVALGVPSESVDLAFRRSLIGLVGGGLIAALAGGALALIVGRRLARPIAALADAAPAIVRGERPPLPAPPVVEIATLTDALEVAAADRERAQAELRRTDRLLQAVFAGTTDAVYVKDLDGRYLTINEAGARLLGGGAASDVVGRDDAAFFAPESARRIAAQDRAVIEAGETRTVENTGLESTGGVVRTYLSTKAPYRDSDGSVIGVMGITRDITARRLAEEERARALEREQEARAEAEIANRAKDEFLAMLSHELRTPLNAVYGWARMLRRGQLDPGTSSRALEVIERNATAQLQLIEDLLDISRIITGKMRLDVRPVDVASVVSEAMDAMRPAADAKDIRLRSVLDPRAGPIMGDPDRLQQVVWNLVSNAVKFTPRGGRIDVTAGRVNSHVEITVSDTGQGIAESVLPYVFDRFRQADSTSTRAHGGLGLGLALVRHLTELHGGSVTARSAGEGRGATFVVRLPVSIVRPDAGAATHPTARQRPAARGPFPRSLEGVRVLVVDDDADALEMVATMLREAGAEPRTCPSAATAIEELRDWQADVLLSDLEMPGEDGYALLRRVQALERERGTRLPAVALTAYGRIEDRVRTLSAGFAMHLPKPVDPAELVAVVGALARGRQPAV